MTLIGLKLGCLLLLALFVLFGILLAKLIDFEAER
jgi:hypothetical protein